MAVSGLADHHRTPRQTCAWLGNQELVVYTTTYDRIISYNPHSDGTDLNGHRQRWPSNFRGRAVSPGADSFLIQCAGSSPGMIPVTSGLWLASS